MRILGQAREGRRHHHSTLWNRQTENPINQEGARSSRHGKLPTLPVDSNFLLLPYPVISRVTSSVRIIGSIKRRHTHTHPPCSCSHPVPLLVGVEAHAPLSARSPSSTRTAPRHQPADSPLAVPFMSQVWTYTQIGAIF